MGVELQIALYGRFESGDVFNAFNQLAVAVDDECGGQRCHVVAQQVGGSFFGRVVDGYPWEVACGLFPEEFVIVDRHLVDFQPFVFVGVVDFGQFEVEGG